MMTEMQPAVLRRTATFVVRLWVEPTTGGDTSWRGQIEHLQSGDRRGFVKLTCIDEFIADHLGREEERLMAR